VIQKIHNYESKIWVPMLAIKGNDKLGIHALPFMTSAIHLPNSKLNNQRCVESAWAVIR
jgi:hypothetical protein